MHVKKLIAGLLTSAFFTGAAAQADASEGSITVFHCMGAGGRNATVSTIAKPHLPTKAVLDRSIFGTEPGSYKQEKPVLGGIGKKLDLIEQAMEYCALSPAAEDAATQEYNIGNDDNDYKVVGLYSCIGKGGHGAEISSRVVAGKVIDTTFSLTRQQVDKYGKLHMDRTRIVADGTGAQEKSDLVKQATVFCVFDPKLGF